MEVRVVQRRRHEQISTTARRGVGRARGTESSPRAKQNHEASRPGEGMWYRKGVMNKSVPQQDAAPEVRVVQNRCRGPISTTKRRGRRGDVVQKRRHEQISTIARLGAGRARGTESLPRANQYHEASRPGGWSWYRRYVTNKSVPQQDAALEERVVQNRRRGPNSATRRRGREVRVVQRRCHEQNSTTARRGAGSVRGTETSAGGRQGHEARCR